jgi:uncharacterized protein
MNKTALIIFIKNTGEVKTRIANEKGKEVAASIYKELLDATIELCTQLKDKIDIHLFFTANNTTSIWHDVSNLQHLQAEGDLGNKMLKAFEEIIENYGKVMIIGSDCPYITKGIILEGEKLLDKSDVVVGPALDGGYYLLGMKKLYHRIFEGIDWSSDQVYYQTCDRLFELRCTFSTLEKLSDIDYYQDYIQWKIQSYD